MKKLICIILVLALCFTSSTFAFASTSAPNSKHEALTVNSNLYNDAWLLERGEYEITTEDNVIKIPASTCNEIIIENDDVGKLTMELSGKFRKANINELDTSSLICESIDGKTKLIVDVDKKTENGSSYDVINTTAIFKEFERAISAPVRFQIVDGYELMSAEEYYHDATIDPGWVYIVDSNNLLTDSITGETYCEIVAAISPAIAIDAKGDYLNSYYTFNENELTQSVELDENVEFPIELVSTTSTRPDNVLLTSGSDSEQIDNGKISALITLGGFIGDVASDGFKKAFGDQVLEELEEKLTSKLIGKGLVALAKVVAKILLIVDVYAAWQYFVNGYNYTNIDYSYEEWRIYKHQGGRWVAGYQEKAWIDRIYAS